TRRVADTTGVKESPAPKRARRNPPAPKVPRTPRTKTAAAGPRKGSATLPAESVLTPLDNSATKTSTPTDIVAASAQPDITSTTQPSDVVASPAEAVVPKR